MISRSSAVQDHSTSSVVDYRLLAWTLVAGVLLAIAVYAVSVSPAPDPDAVVTMAVPP
jgi:hypothetical protein